MQHIQVPCIWTAVANATVWSLLVHEITFMQPYIKSDNFSSVCKILLVTHFTQSAKSLVPQLDLME